MSFPTVVMIHAKTGAEATVPLEEVASFKALGYREKSTEAPEKAKA